jgi:hypothetical protein
MTRSRMTPIQRELLALFARYQVGGLVNDIDALGVRFSGSEPVPLSVHKAVMQLLAAIGELGCTDGAKPLAADVWRSRDD